ncbi:syncytin-1 [Fukomys damarensis]|uniref:syncytin-1 n=1 Tax=Fukomys damarensis TaxID=885580 RepID=UPI0014552545|nr:syncytin-1 [Fukomys damarensis]
MRLPPQLIDICNSTYLVNGNDSYVLSPNGTYFACSTGLTPLLVPQLFLAHRDYCVLVLLLPRLTVRPKDDLLFSSTDSSLLRHTREPVSAITIAVLLGLGAAGAGTGIYSLVPSTENFNQLQRAVDADIRQLKQGLKHLKETVASLAEVVLQNRRGLDLAFLREGGVCAALKEECCFFKDKLGLVDDSIRRVEESLKQRQRQREKD